MRRARRRSWRLTGRRTLDLALPLALGLLLGLLLIILPPTRHAFAPGAEPPSVALNGFYGVERNEGGPFRWSRPSAAIGMPLAAPGSYRVVIAMADNPAVIPPRTVRVNINGVPAGSVQLSATPRDYSFIHMVEPRAWEAGRERDLRVALETTPWSVPGDSRALGVIVTHVRVGPSPALLPWQMAILAPVMFFVVAGWATARRAGLPLAGTALVTVGLLLALGLWALGGRSAVFALARRPFTHPLSYLTVLGFAILLPPTWAMFRRDAQARSAWPFARRGDTIALLVAVALGAITAFHRLGTKGLWGDEVWEASWSRQQGLVATIARFRDPPDLPLHFVLTRLATTFGNDEFWVRLPSALLGTATVALVFLLGRIVWNTPVGLIAAALLASAPYHVWYAQDARPYAGLACYSTLLLLAFVAILRRPTRPSLLAWLGFMLAVACNLLNHLFGALPLAIVAFAAGGWAIWLLFGASRAVGNRRDRYLLATRRGLLALTSAIATSAILTLPVQDGIVDYVRQGGTDPGSVPFRLTAPLAVELFGSFGFGTGWRLALVAGLAVVGVGATLRRQRPFALLVLAWLLLPLVLLALAQPRHNFILRYLLFMQPVYLLLAAHGLWQMAAWIGLFISRLRPASGRRLRPAIAAVLVASLLATGLPITWQGYRVEKITDWSAACRYLHADVAPEDRITGDGYFDGIMTWCFPDRTPGVVVRSDGKPPEEIAAMKTTVWYLAIGPDDPVREARFLESGFAIVPRAAWARAELVSPLDGCMPSLPLTFPQSEPPLAIYVSGPGKSGRPPAAQTARSRCGAR